VATTFRPEAAYEFIGAASAQQNRCIGVLFPDPASDGSQTLRVLTGTDDEDRGLRTEIGRGTTGETSQLHFGPRGSNVGWLGPKLAGRLNQGRVGAAGRRGELRPAACERLRASWAFSSAGVSLSTTPASISPRRAAASLTTTVVVAMVGPFLAQCRLGI
jgi:hypothetical protein